MPRSTKITIKVKTIEAEVAEEEAVVIVEVVGAEAAVEVIKAINIKMIETIKEMIKIKMRRLLINPLSKV